MEVLSRGYAVSVPADRDASQLYTTHAVSLCAYYYVPGSWGGGIELGERC